MPKINVAVVGAGVIGLSVGVRLLESFKTLSVTILADKFHPHITSSNAGGLVYPDPGLDPQRSMATVRYLKELYQSGVGSNVGLRRLPTFVYFTEKKERPSWADDVDDFEALSKTEAAKRGLASEPYDTIFSFKCFVLEPNTYLPWLMEKFRLLGGTFEQRYIDNLHGLKDYQLVVNCTGLGSRVLAGDQQLHPVRGQIVAVKVPPYFQDQPEIHIWDEGAEGEGETLTYVIPHNDVILLGGIRDPHSWSVEVDEQQTKSICNRCLKLSPKLGNLEIVRAWACLRPVRNGVRLEPECESSLPHVIHCYGHGGSGYVLHWGCALEVQDFIEKQLFKFIK